MLAYKESEHEENLLSHEEMKEKHKRWLLRLNSPGEQY